MDALKDRVGGFTECTFMMACPVLLAVATKKVNMSSEGNTAVRHGIPPLAAISLFLCPLAFIPLGYASARKADVSRSLKLWILRWTTGLVHLSAISQMVLAYMILLLIVTVKSKTLLYLLLLVPLCLSVSALGIWSVARRAVDDDRDEAHQAGNNERLFNKKLELSLDLSAAVTYLLFLGLEGLALEGQTKVGKDLTPSLGKPIVVTFVCCVLASLLMLLVTVPPIDHEQAAERGDGGRLVHTTIHIMWAVLAICITAVVIMILLFELSIAAGFTVALIPCGVLFVSYVLCLCVPERRGWDEYSDDQLTPPPSLEMTKVTFTAFLAISLPSFRDGRLSGCNLAFIVTAAMSVIFGLGWRLLTHFKQNAAVWTSKVACLCTHAWLAAAAVELMCMAKQAL